MSTFKVCSVFVTLTALLVDGLTSAISVDRVPRQTAVTKQGAAVLFFAAHQGSLRDIKYSPIIFNDVLVNQGSGYNNGTGRFTAPVAGIYQFVFAAQLCRGEHNNVWKFIVQGQPMMDCHAQVFDGTTTLNTCYFMYELMKGDQVWIQQEVGSCAWANRVTRGITFSGALLASEGVSTLGAKYGSRNSCPLIAGGNKLTLSSSADLRAASSGVVVTLLLCSLIFNSPW